MTAVDATTEIQRPVVEYKAREVGGVPDAQRTPKQRQEQGSV